MKLFSEALSINQKKRAVVFIPIFINQIKKILFYAAKLHLKLNNNVFKMQYI